MGKPIIWASEAPKRNVLAPSAEKQAQGWVSETPPFEWFNWYMRRNDERLASLEDPQSFVVLDIPAQKRFGAIKKGERFNLPAPYIVGSSQLRVYIDDILCHPGKDRQYVECGAEFSESEYIRFNDDIDRKFDVRVEILRRRDDCDIYDSELVSGQIASLKKRLERLEEPIFSYRMDSPANTREETIRAGELLTLDAEYIVGAGQIFVFKNGILLYEGKDYHEIGKDGDKGSDISFAEDLPVSDNLRIVVSIRGSEENIILSEAASLKTIGEKVALLTREERRDEIIRERIEAMADYAVPPYRVGSDTLRVYKNGALLMPNRDYSENSDEGEISTRIIFNASVAAESIITAIAPALPK